MRFFCVCVRVSIMLILKQGDLVKSVKVLIMQFN